MPPKNVSTTLKPIRLQSVAHLKVRNPDKSEASPCIGPMTAMLSCWASSGSNPSGQGCAHLEKALRECMDTPKTTGTKKNNINYHLGRLYPQIRGPQRKKG
ncbi:hypothetical protein BT93_L5050 [Corymbia citriodora subsp. variegata]|uniref:37S ribosomal protein mrp10, mitochondrial n=1 Tax=Corymbia citriodora subsp. variegata TaxID=360336 RepID=A0A8T0CHE3_CORYI|nr:hypothetical protein BT93_L5050 [Corymbia citriodora subsp. variegata]